MPTAIHQFKKRLRNYDATWRYLYNLGPTLKYQMSKPSLNGEVARVVEELQREGVCVTSVDRLLGGSTIFQQMVQAVEDLQTSLCLQITTARQKLNDPADIGKKTFMMEYLGRNPVLDPSSVFARFALQQPMLQIANAYLGMYTRLRYYNVWHTFASKSQARESQLWHRDREDRYILKVFAYLSDVDEGAGPFTYACSTHRKGRFQKDPECFMEGHVRRSDDEQMGKVVPPNQWLKGIGPKGTIIFADTQGYHKGGLAREHDRLMYTCMFTSRASESEEFFVRSKPYDPPADIAEAFALR